MICVYCKNNIENGSNFCNFCGKQISGEVICPGCQTRVSAASKFCNKCGDCLQKPIYFDIYYGGDGTYSCNNKEFFNNLFECMEKENENYIKIFQEPNEWVSGISRLLKSSSWDTKKYKNNAQGFIINYLLRKGFKLETMSRNEGTIVDRYKKE